MTQLFAGPRVRLGPVEPDTDAAIESGWTHDGEWLRLIDTAPARPLSPLQVKKRYEKDEKESDKTFHFAVRLNAAPAPAGGPATAGRLIGFARLQWVDWLHRVALLNVGIGNPADRGQGYGQEALDLLRRYAYNELGLHRLAVYIGGYNTGAAKFLERNGFRLEVRRRLALARDGQRWDLLQYAQLRPEWLAHQPAAGGGLEGDGT